MSKIPFGEYFGALRRLQDAGELKTTLLGIGPMSERILRAAFEISGDYRFPLMFIASRNQVDMDDFGGGYVNSWNQEGFMTAVERTAGETQFDGVMYVCRDHGGPWQRDDEYRAFLGEKEAMDRAKRSFAEDMERGFDLLHIDPTKDPHVGGVISLEVVISRSIELISCAEALRRERGLPDMCYEIGTEETSGGLISPEAYTAFIENLTEKLGAMSLPRPSFIVGQTGTLTRMTRNVGSFDPETAHMLSAAAGGYGLGLKEHNADYLPDHTLMFHPFLGILAANVAPEFAVAESRALLELSFLEREAHRLGYIDIPSGFQEVFCRCAIESGRWKKWVTGDMAPVTEDEILGDERLTYEYTRVCGHYVFSHPAVRERSSRMIENLTRLGMRPEDYILSSIKKSIYRYVECFNLTGLDDRVEKLLGKAG